MAVLLEDKPDEGDQVKFEAPMAVKLTLSPEQIVGDKGVTEIPGTLVTVTVTFALDVQPAEVPVTVYVVVLAGLAVTIAPLVAERPLAGLQL